MGARVAVSTEVSNSIGMYMMEVEVGAMDILKWNLKYLGWKYQKLICESKKDLDQPIQNEQKPVAEQL